MNKVNSEYEEYKKFREAYFKKKEKNQKRPKKSKKAVSIKSSNPKENFFCPSCKKLVIKKDVGLSTEYGYCESCKKDWFLFECKKLYYFCRECDYETTVKSRYQAHLKTRKHLINLKKGEDKLCKKCGLPMEDNKDYLCCKVCGSTILKETERIRSWTEVKKEVWERDGGKCIQCGSLQNLEVKRIISRFKGGKNIPINLKLICNDCKN